MAVDEENVSKIFSTLSHPLRREIILYLGKKKQASFSDIAKTFNVDTGKLSFHLRSLEEFLEQTPKGKYRLGYIGKNAIVLIKDIEVWATEAESAKRPFIRPIARPLVRTVASLIDVILTLGLFILLPNLLSAFQPLTIDLYVYVLFFLTIFWVYLTLLEGFGGQSLGKAITRIKVVRTDGENISYEQAAVRNFGKVFLLPIDLALGSRLKDRRFLRFFDRYLGTTVIDIEP
ncbi:RDD family protein [Candidatus Bathyarchaeota archaeon]|nr:RDD family protein [Candidatus Bathyarchaeota archaeon]